MRCRRRRRVRILIPWRPSDSRRRSRRIFDTAPAEAAANKTPKIIATDLLPHTAEKIPRPSVGAPGMEPGIPRPAMTGTRLNPRAERSASIVGVRRAGRVGGRDPTAPGRAPHTILAPRTKPALAEEPAKNAEASAG